MICDVPSTTEAFVCGAPAPIVFKSTEPTTTEKATLAILSLVDIAQTERWLTSPTCHGCTPHVENDPLLGSHPSLLRMAATGVAMDELVLHVRSPFIHRLSIGLEAGNVVRNTVVVGMRI
jgi:hypothetical protein